MKKLLTPPRKKMMVQPRKKMLSPTREEEGKLAEEEERSTPLSPNLETTPSKPPQEEVEVEEEEAQAEAAQEEEETQAEEAPAEEVQEEAPVEEELEEEDVVVIRMAEMSIPKASPESPMTGVIMMAFPAMSQGPASLRTQVKAKGDALALRVVVSLLLLNKLLKRWLSSQRKT